MVKRINQSINQSINHRIIVVGRIDIKGNDILKRVYDSEGISPTLSTMQGGNKQPKVVVPVLTPDRLEKRQNGRRFKEDGEPSFTANTQDRHGVMIIDPQGRKNKICVPKRECPTLRAQCHGNLPLVIDDTIRSSRSGLKTISNYCIRKLTPKECLRLMGFSDEDYDKLKEAKMSDTQIYKVCGNSIVTTVPKSIFSSLLSTKEE
jgi:DNA (cytosine-5)-methyltransferase 1